MAAQPTALGLVRRAGRREWSAAMERVDLGPLRVSRLCLGTMLMGGRTPADGGAAPARRLRGGRATTSSTPPTSTATAPPSGRSRRGSRAAATRSWWRPSCASRSPTRAAPGLAPERVVRGVRRVAAAPGHRRHRPLPGPRARSRRRARGHAGGARRPRARGQGARARRLELPRLAAGVGGRACRIARASPPSSRCSRSTRSSSARSRPRSCPSAAPPGSGVLPWGPLGAGFLTGRYERDDAPPAGTRIGDASDDLEEAMHRRGTEANFRAVDEARAVADELGASVAQVALAWLLAQPGVTAPIIGPRTLDQLEDLLPAAELALTDEQVARLGRWTAPGARLSRAHAHRAERDRRRQHAAAAPSLRRAARRSRTPIADRRPARNPARSRDFAW